MNLNKRAKLTLTLIPLTTLIICCYFGIYHSHKYFKFDLKLFIAVLGILSLAGLDCIYFDIKSKWRKLRTLAILIFIGGPISIIVVVLHESYVDQQLENYGTSSYGIVTRLYSRTAKRRTSHYAEFEYTVNDKKWIQEVYNNKLTLDYGDTLKLRCSTQDPEIFEIQQSILKKLNKE